MKRIFLRLKQPLRNERGEITFFACFFVVGIVMLISFLLLYASIRITCINIRNGAKMELNNLSGTIYADTYRSQRETNFEEYLNTLYSSSDYTDMLEATVAGGLDSKIPLSTEDYKVSDISLDFNVEDIWLAILAGYFLPIKSMKLYGAKTVKTAALPLPVSSVRSGVN